MIDWLSRWLHWFRYGNDTRPTGGRLEMWDDVSRCPDCGGLKFKIVDNMGDAPQIRMTCKNCGSHWHRVQLVHKYKLKRANLLDPDFKSSGESYDR